MNPVLSPPPIQSMVLDPSEAVARINLLADALNSERFQILVGSEEIIFNTPKDLLGRCSPVFRAMCNSSFEESEKRLIRLPHVKPSIFKHFYVWLHTSSPKSINTSDISDITELAVFSDMYEILALKNLTSDLLQVALHSISFEKLMEIIPYVYENTVDGSTVQELVSLRFVKYYGNALFPMPPNLPEVIKVFEQYAAFGRDYFIRSQTNAHEALLIHGTCRFHDHPNKVPRTRRRRPNSQFGSFGGAEQGGIGDSILSKPPEQTNPLSPLGGIRGTDYHHSQPGTCPFVAGDWVDYCWKEDMARKDTEKNGVMKGGTGEEKGEENN